MTATRFALLVWLLAVVPHEPAAQAPEAWPPPGVLLPGTAADPASMRSSANRLPNERPRWLPRSATAQES